MELTVEQLKHDLTVLNHRKTMAHENLHQIIGAISVIEQIIDRLNQKEIESKDDESEDEKELDHGEINNEAA